LKKVCYKVSLCENCQRQSCKTFIGLTNRAKIIGGVRPLVPKILDQSYRVGVKSPNFTALHGMQTRSSDENSVCPSVRPSACHTRVLWQDGRQICRDLYTIWKTI